MVHASSGIVRGALAAFMVCSLALSGCFDDDDRSASGPTGDDDVTPDDAPDDPLGLPPGLPDPSAPPQLPEPPGVPPQLPEPPGVPPPAGPLELAIVEAECGILGKTLRLGVPVLRIERCV